VGAWFDAGWAWRGDAAVELFGSPAGELARLEIWATTGSCYRRAGVTSDGGSVLAGPGATS